MRLRRRTCVSEFFDIIELKPQRQKIRPHYYQLLKALSNAARSGLGGPWESRACRKLRYSNPTTWPHSKTSQGVTGHDSLSDPAPFFLSALAALPLSPLFLASPLSLSSSLSPPCVVSRSCGLQPAPSHRNERAHLRRVGRHVAERPGALVDGHHQLDVVAFGAGVSVAEDAANRRAGNLRSSGETRQISSRCMD